jgi:hypothetical protein
MPYEGYILSDKSYATCFYLTGFPAVINGLDNFPAENSIVPSLVEGQDLQAENTIMMGSANLIGFIGPMVAGILIGAYSISFEGIGLAFAADAVSFAVSAGCLWLMHIIGPLLAGIPVLAD